MTRQQKFINAYKSLQELDHKARQLKSASHRYHDHTRDYDESINTLSPRDMLAKQKEFNVQDRSFHDVMDSYERHLKEHNDLIEELAPIGKDPVSVTIAGKQLRLQIDDKEGLRVIQNKK